MTPSPHCHRTAPRRSYIYRLMLVTGGDLNDHTILQYISYLSLLDLYDLRGARRRLLGPVFAVDRSESDVTLISLRAYLNSVLRDFNTPTRTHLGPRRVVRPWVLSALSPVTSALRLSTSVTSVLRPHVTSRAYKLHRLQVTSLTRYTFLPSIEPLTPILAEISGLRLPDTLRTAPQPDAPAPLALPCGAHSIPLTRHNSESPPTVRQHSQASFPDPLT